MAANTISVTSGQTLSYTGSSYVLYNSGGTVSTYTSPTPADQIHVVSGATISNISIGSGGEVFVSSGGSAVGLVVSSGGIVDEVNAGAFVGNPIYVYSGAEVEFAFVAASTTTSATVLSSSVDGNGNETITATEGVRSMSITVSGTPAYTYSTIGGKSGIVFTADTAACYLTGTMIAAEQGDAAIETIRAGDKVVVRRNGTDVLEVVNWVGHSTIDLSRHAHPELSAPIRVKAGALGDNLPTRHLVLSPEHCLLLNGLCVPVKLLVNGGSIVREFPAEAFTYYHLELEKHGMLLAEGVEAESYLDTGNRRSFDNADTPRLVHPTFEVNPTSHRWLTDACAPLAKVPEDVAPIWQSLAERSDSIGHKLSVPTFVENPDVHLTVDGKRIQPTSDRNGRYVFMVPAGAKSVSLDSRFCIPADQMIPGMRDTRRLGVSVDWMAIRTSTTETILSADHPSLSAGWNDIERDGETMWRWTDGSATIPWTNVEGSAVLTVKCKPVPQYPVYDEKLRLVA